MSDNKKKSTKDLGDEEILEILMGNRKEQHTESHKMIKAKNFSEAYPDAEEEEMVLCDHCGADLETNFYHCLECGSFDICQRCYDEEYGKNVKITPELVLEEMKSSFVLKYTHVVENLADKTKPVCLNIFLQATGAVGLQEGFGSPFKKVQIPPEDLSEVKNVAAKAYIAIKSLESKSEESTSKESSDPNTIVDKSVNLIIGSNSLKYDVKEDSPSEVKELVRFVVDVVEKNKTNPSS
eukprot:TRINITY_DN2426_c0_g1_i1.p1 TRINITY_DN2426_c0_g1~~TRINITY_DN2426_c0_g1_i1.p1  ORF type:complete len:238 (-),score=57.86 TRINITY_DN2426_c0_g1_i1:7-720(-)